jgi:hypothetical protein
MPRIAEIRRVRYPALLGIFQWATWVLRWRFAAWLFFSVGLIVALSQKEEAAKGIV